MKGKVKTLYMGDKIKLTEEKLLHKVEVMNSYLREETCQRLEKKSLPLMHFDGAYVLKNRFLHGEQVENTIFYYDADGNYVTCREKNNPLISLPYSMDTNSGRKTTAFSHLLTGKDLYAVYEGDRLVFEHNRESVPPKSKADLYANGKYFKSKHYVYGCNSSGYLYRRHYANYANYRSTYDQYDADGNLIRENLGLKEVLELVYPGNKIYEIYNSISDSYKVGGVNLTKDDIIWGSSRRKVYLKGDNFYFLLEDGIKCCIIEFECKEHNCMRYLLLDNTLYWAIEGGCTVINSVYTVPVCDGHSHVMFDRNGQLLFRDAPYHEYGTYNGEYIIRKDMLYKPDFSNTVTGDGEVLESDYPITKDMRGEVYLIDKKFLVFRNNKWHLFYKTEKIRTENVLKKYKNFRFNKRKTVFYQDRQTKDIYILEDNDDVYCLPASEYDVDSIRLISDRAALITGIDGKQYCVNNRGLKCEVFPLEEYSAFSGDYNIVGIKPDGEIFINGKRMYFTDGVVKTENGEVLWDNVKLTGFSLISTEDLEDCKAYAHIILNEGNSAGYHLDGESLLQNEYLDCYKNSKGCFAYLKNEGYAVEINEPTLNECEKTIASTKRGYFIKGYLIVDPMLSMVERYSPSIYSSLADKIEQIEVENKQELQTFIRETLLEEIISEAKKYGVNIERQHIENRPNIKDVLTVLLNLDNLEEHCSISFKRLAADITGVLTDENYDFTGTEYFKNLNVGNRKNFMGYGLSIEKFSSFPEEITFRSTTTKNRLLKDTLGQTLFTQLFNMVGSRAKGMPGVFQLTNLEYLNNLSSDLDGMSVSEVIENMAPSEKVKTIKFLNKCGYKFFGLIKKYQIEFAHSSMRINGQTPDKVTMRKLKKIADDLIKIKENVIKDIQKSSINSDIKEYVIKYCKWAISHVERDFSTVHVGEKDGKEKEFTIKLWNRKDLITNLVQGTKTHCCIAADSYNVGALIGYIYNENINLVEIRHKGDVVGQAFVYMAVSAQKIMYRYERKHHIFMVIDNVEINNNYAQYAEDIAIHLQKFMAKYAEYVSPGISDILLGTNYNDINPPYTFSAYINLNTVGYDFYKDNSGSFYKFI